jgi:hypothetical protein
VRPHTIIELSMIESVAKRSAVVYKNRNACKGQCLTPL